MKTFAVLLPMKDEKLSHAHRSEHLEFLKQLEDAGQVVAKGPFVDGSGGLVIYKSRSYEEVEEIVKTDPYVIHKARDYEIREWKVL